MTVESRALPGQEHRALLSGLPVAVYVCDRQGRITFYNRKAVELWGREPVVSDRYCGSLRLYSPEGVIVPLAECSMAKALKEGRLVAGQPVVIERPDGSRVHALAHVLPLRDASGELEGAINVVADIGALGSAGEAAARLAAIVESSDDAIVGKTLEGIITSWNAGAERIYGYTAEEMIGQPITRIIPRDRLHEEEQILARLQRGERVEHFETRRVTRDHRLIDVSLTISPIRDRNGRIIGASKISRDITEKKAAEAELKSMKERLEVRVAERTALAEHRARQLSRLAAELIDAEQRERKRIAEVLHDELAQNLALARMRLVAGERDPATIAELLRQTSDVIGGIMNSARNLMRDLSPSVLFDVGLLAALESLAERWSSLHGLKIQVRKLGDEPTLTDELRTFAFRAVREALYNVAKHSQSSEAHVTLDGRDPDVLCLEVADRGIGFDPVQLDKSSGSDRFGLFSIRERAALLGGEVEVESAPGQGTRFRLRLPLKAMALAANGRNPAKRRPAPATGTASDGMTEPRAVRVLLADDHVVMREGLANLLGRQPGIRIVGQAANGVEAVELARQLKPDVIIMDVSMPRMSGLEATRVIHKEMPGIRIVGLSMHEDRTVADSMRSAGASTYLTKGEDPKSLIDAVCGPTAP